MEKREFRRVRRSRPQHNTTHDDSPRETDNKPSRRGHPPPPQPPDKKIDYTAIPDPHMFDNLKRETDEIAALKKKKPSVRHVISTWAKYEDAFTPPVEEEQSGADFETLIQGACLGGHFQFKSEQDWNAHGSVLQNEIFQLNVNCLSDGLACIPFYERMQLPVDMFNLSDLEHMDTTASKNLEAYNIRGKLEVKRKKSVIRDSRKAVPDGMESFSIYDSKENVEETKAPDIAFNFDISQSETGSVEDVVDTKSHKVEQESDATKKAAEMQQQQYHLLQFRNEDRSCSLEGNVDRVILRATSDIQKPDRENSPLKYVTYSEEAVSVGHRERTSVLNENKESLDRKENSENDRLYRTHPHKNLNISNYEEEDSEPNTQYRYSVEGRKYTEYGIAMNQGVPLEERRASVYKNETKRNGEQETEVSVHPKDSVENMNQQEWTEKDGAGKRRRGNRGKKKKKGSEETEYGIMSTMNDPYTEEQHKEPSVGIPCERGEENYTAGPRVPPHKEIQKVPTLRASPQRDQNVRPRNDLDRESNTVRSYSPVHSKSHEFQLREKYALQLDAQPDVRGQKNQTPEQSVKQEKISALSESYGENVAEHDMQPDIRRQKSQTPQRFVKEENISFASEQHEDRSMVGRNMQPEVRRAKSHTSDHYVKEERISSTLLSHEEGMREKSKLEHNPQSEVIRRKSQTHEQSERVIPMSKSENQRQITPEPENAKKNVMSDKISNSRNVKTLNTPEHAPQLAEGVAVAVRESSCRNATKPSPALGLLDNAKGKPTAKGAQDDDLDFLLSLKKQVTDQPVQFAKPTNALRSSIEDEDTVRQLPPISAVQKTEDLEDWLDLMLDD